MFKNLNRKLMLTGLTMAATTTGWLSGCTWNDFQFLCPWC